MNKSYGNWAYNYKSNIVFKCPKDCNKKHEHYFGFYEKALIYFNANTEYNKDVDEKLYKIIIYHQLSDRTITKTSAELYYILMQVCNNKQYFLNVEERHDKIIELLNKANNDFLIKDKEILSFNENDNVPNRMKNRLYRFKKWKKEMEYYGGVDYI